MPEFAELLNELRNPSEDGPSETIYDDISNTFNHAVETRDAKISESEERIKESESEISKLKSANYDLMMSSSVGNGGDTETVEDETDSSEGIDDLF